MRELGGSSLVEILVAVTLIGIAAAGTLQTMSILNRNAASIRLLTNAREIVARNIDTTLSESWSASNQPAILALTPASGSVYEDDVTLDNEVAVATQSDGVDLVRGVLTRTVVAVPNAVNADVRRIKFQINYSYRGRDFTYALTTMRAIDD
ncbi:MAG: hypothetical protein JWL59_4534 [Chthoniobacteraceae bacterium]|nr:hypothetical protein [Chthoniobacteraceae bacterium]